LAIRIRIIRKQAPPAVRLGALIVENSSMPELNRFLQRTHVKLWPKQPKPCRNIAKTYVAGSLMFIDKLMAVWDLNHHFIVSYCSVPLKFENYGQYLTKLDNIVVA